MNVLCVLARVPAPGEGKTRLRARLGHEVANRLAHAFVHDVLDWAAAAADAVLVAHDGPAELLPAVAGRCIVVAQVQGDFGERLSAAVDAGFEHGADRVVIVGTDSPTLPADLVDAAFAGLDHSASTLVPARDGGWIALGVDRPLARTLAAVTWSSPLTAAETIAALRDDGREPLVLPGWYDIDEPGDLDGIARDPASALRAPRTCSLLSQA